MKIRLPTIHKLQDSIPTDKALHFAFSYMLTGLCYLLIGISLPVSVAIVAAIGVGKELFVDDTADMSDILADAAGIVLFAVCVM